MKSLTIYLEDKEFNKLKRLKKKLGLTWKEMLLVYLVKDE